MCCRSHRARWWYRVSEVEGYVDVAVMYAVLVVLALLALAILLPRMVPG